MSLISGEKHTDRCMIEKFEAQIVLVFKTKIDLKMTRHSCFNPWSKQYSVQGLIMVSLSFLTPSPV